jgi:orotidine-5'-phosphate decarboxylase
MFLLYNKAIIDAVSDIVPAVKPQIAMYEKFGLDGLSAYIRTCEYAASKGLYVIGDIKRGDIASTAEAYAAHLSGADMGADMPAVDLWRGRGHGQSVFRHGRRCAVCESLQGNRQDHIRARKDEQQKQRRAAGSCGQRRRRR